jgi:release factor glutamine methyltransferase
MFEGWPDGSASFDLIVSNPPYVPEPQLPTLQPEVRREPESALSAGRDGLSAIRRLVGGAAAHLRGDGLLLFELGFGQSAAVAHMISADPHLAMEGFRSDLQGIPRVAIARRGNPSENSELRITNSDFRL